MHNTRLNTQATALSSKAPHARNIVQGEYATSDDDRAMFTTILGSCVSVCLFDSETRVGGMNHFLLPEGTKTAVDEMRFGLHAMELLINDLLKQNAMKTSLKAKLFGGANMMSGLTDVGARNIAFAKQFLNDEGFPILAEQTGGTKGRRLRFWPTTGRAQMRYIMPHDGEIVPNADIQIKPKSDIELF